MVQSTRFILLMRQWKLGDFKLHNKLFAEGRLEPLSAVAQLTDFLDQDICPHTLTLYRMKVSVRAGEGVLLSTIKASGQRTRSPKAASSHSGCPSCLPFLPRFSRRGEQSMSADPWPARDFGPWRWWIAGLSLEKWSLRTGGSRSGLGTCCDCEVVGRF